jgi:hypothetical protein
MEPDTKELFAFHSSLPHSVWEKKSNQDRLDNLQEACFVKSNFESA